MNLRLRLLIRLRPVLRFINTRILHIDDSPEYIARGIAIGLFTAWLPLLGLQIIIAVLMATVLKANKAMAALFVWVSNPLTAVIMYYPAYRLGRFLLGFSQSEPVVEAEQIEDLFTETLSLSRIITEFFEPELWKQIHDMFWSVGQEMFLGGVLLGLVAALVGYRSGLQFVTWQRAKRARRRARRQTQSHFQT